VKISFFVEHLFFAGKNKIIGIENKIEKRKEERGKCKVLTEW